MIFSDVSKFYGETAVLKHLDFEIREGEITAILGESGAGKTTLLNICAGLTTFSGERDGVRGDKIRRRAGISYLFQDCKLLPNLTVRENLKFVLKKSDWEKILPMLERVGLAGKENSRPKELSGGERQRVAIARAFLYPHELLLMDEPFSALDLSLKKSLILLVCELWSERKNTVVFVTHDVREAVLLAGRALVLKGGELILDLDIPAPYPRDFLAPPQESETLVRALLGEVRQPLQKL